MILLVQIVKHHIKYIEIHGIDEVILMTRSDHQKLHRRLRKEGKLNIPVEKLNIISQRASLRDPAIIHSNGLEEEYNKQMELKKMRYEHKTTSTKEHAVKIIFDNAVEMIENVAKPVNGGVQVCVPNSWIGRRVAVVKLKD